jgi:hypothetical protein
MYVDSVLMANRNEFLAYDGEVNGKYVSNVGRRVDVGVYEGAGPHITDALFRSVLVENFDTNLEARDFAYMLSKVGDAARIL